jgi:hypothetical protein
VILCTGIRPSIGTKNFIPEEVNYSKITIRVTVRLSNTMDAEFVVLALVAVVVVSVMTLNPLEGRFG